MSVIKVRLPNRNTKTFQLDIFGVGLLVSYETVVAADYKGTKIRRRNEWGPTTMRHMSEANVKGYVEMEQEAFDAEVRKLLFKGAAEDLTKGML